MEFHRVAESRLCLLEKCHPPVFQVARINFFKVLGSGNTKETSFSCGMSHLPDFILGSTA